LGLALGLWALAGRARAQTFVGIPQPMGYENDVYCFGYVGSPNELFTGAIVSGDAVSAQSSFFYNDIIYSPASADLKAGDEYWIITGQDDVFDPVTAAYLGRFYEYRGRARALCVKGENAVLQITFTCSDIPLYAHLKPFEPIPIPLARPSLPVTVCDVPNGKPVGEIAYNRNGVELMATGSDMIINMGLDANLSPGDFLTVFRYSIPREFDISASGELISRKTPAYLPRTILGEAVVLTVGDHTSTCRIANSTEYIGWGDFVELK
jgi:hypothetical protein